MLRLRVRPPGGQGYVVDLKTFPVRIGRAPASDLRLDDPFTSRLHTELWLEKGELVVSDRRSGNGTFLNGLRLTADTPVHAGDRVRVGNSVLEIEAFEPDATVSVRRPAERPRRPRRRPADTVATDPLALAARELKACLLPEAPPVVEGYELAGASYSSAEVGGESFDFVDLGRGRVLLAQADASGKGLDAALLSTRLHAALAAHADAGASVAELASRLDAFLSRQAPARRFVTLFLALLDSGEHRLTYVNAGHPRPLLVRAGGAIETLAAGGPPLGSTAEAGFEAATEDLAPGDVLIVASDGVLEARNGAGEELPAGWLAEVARRYQGALASELQVLIEQELVGFLGARAPADDRTLTLLRRAP